MRRFGCVLLLAAFAGCAKVDVEAEKTALMTADREWSQTTKDSGQVRELPRARRERIPAGSAGAGWSGRVQKVFLRNDGGPWLCALVDSDQGGRRRERRHWLYHRHVQLDDGRNIGEREIRHGVEEEQRRLEGC
jgi:hypothetical protein